MYYKRVIIVPYKFGSKGAKNLQEGLQAAVDIPVLLVSKKSTKYQPRWTDYVINWGCSADWPWINMTDKHANQTVVNKLDFFEQVGAAKIVWPNCPVNIPEWATDPAIAVSWNKPFFARQRLTGHSGEGIIELQAGEEPANATKAPLYVQYKKKRHEYRVHFFKDGHTYTIIDVTQKKKRVGHEGTNHQIRNHQNGWVYCRENVQEPEGIQQLALNACAAIGLQSGAVDIIWNEKENKCYVLEINTAPGIEGTTCKKYTQSILESLA